MQYSKHSTGLIVLSCFYPFFLFYVGVEKKDSKIMTLEIQHFLVCVLLLHARILLELIDVDLEM